MNNIKVLNTYVEVGKSFLKDKPVLNNLIITNKNIDIFVRDITRLSRNTTDVVNINKLCKEKGIRIYCVMDNSFVDDMIIFEPKELLNL